MNLLVRELFKPHKDFGCFHVLRRPSAIPDEGSRLGRTFSELSGNTLPKGGQLPSYWPMHASNLFGNTRSPFSHVRKPSANPGSSLSIRPPLCPLKLLHHFESREKPDGPFSQTAAHFF